VIVLQLQLQEEKVISKPAIIALLINIRFYCPC
jgi:hypothetical protein